MAPLLKPDAKLPPPPPSLPRLRGSDVRTLLRGSLCWRIYRAAGEHPGRWNEFRSYGPTATGRFDHHEPPPHEDAARAILYAARDATAALAEAFQGTRTIDRRRQEPWLVAFELTADVAALDLTRLWPTRAGASQAIATRRRVTAQAWSRAIYRAYPDVVALAYRSSMAGSSINIALYERGATAISTVPVVHMPLTHPGLALPLARAAAKLGYGLR